MNQILRYWGPAKTTPSNVVPSFLPEEEVASVAQMYPDVIYFFEEAS